TRCSRSCIKEMVVLTRPPGGGAVGSHGQRQPARTPGDPVPCTPGSLPVSGCHTSVAGSVMWPRFDRAVRDGGERRGRLVLGHITTASDDRLLPPTHHERGSCPMLEQYFVKPKTIDRIRGSWIAAEIEGYLVWLVDQG